MIRTIIETNTLLYAMAFTGMLGILGQLLLNRRYRLLLREASGVQMEKRDFMKRLATRYQTDYRRSDGQTDIPLFVRRQLLDYRFWRLSLHQWRRLNAGWYAVSMALGAAGAAYAYRAGMEEIHIQKLLWMGAAVTGVSLAAALWLDIRYKRQSLLTVLENYLAHSGVGRNYKKAVAKVAAETMEDADSREGSLETASCLESSFADVQESEKMKLGGKRKKAPSIVGMRRKDEAVKALRTPNAPAQTRAQREKQELQENLAKIREGTRESAAGLEQKRQRNRELLRQMDAGEQEQIIREVLAEFLA